MNGGNEHPGGGSNEAGGTYNRLLQMSITAADPTVPAVPAAMSDENRAFLQQALRELAPDYISRLRWCIKRLEEIVSDVDLLLDALDEATMHSEKIDLARDFCKMGGFSALKRHIEPTGETDVVHGAAELLATCCQHNEFCQQELVNSGLLKDILAHADSTTNDELRVAYIYVISSAIRAFQPGQEVFLASDGLSLLVRLMQSESDRCRFKSSFLLFCLSMEEEQTAEFRSLVDTMGLPEQLAGMLQGAAPGPYLEYVAGALLSCVKSGRRVLGRCRTAGLDVSFISVSLLEQTRDDEAFTELHTYLKELNMLAEQEAVTTNDEAER